MHSDTLPYGPFVIRLDSSPAISKIKSMKKLFNEAKIPSWERNKIAILRDDENLIWIDGFGTDGKYLPDINSKNVLIIKKEG